MKKVIIILSIVVLATIFYRVYVNNDNIGQWFNNVTNGVIGTTKTYKEVTIGKQIWMAENLDEDKFRNGDPIPEVKTMLDWYFAAEKHKPAWCYYENNTIYGKKYGKLYNVYAVQDPRGLAPKGWHMPNSAEWGILNETLGGKYNRPGEKMMTKVGWIDGGNGTNISGFSGLPAGYRTSSGNFYKIGEFTGWWSKRNQESFTNDPRPYYDKYAYLSIYYNFLGWGYSVNDGPSGGGSGLSVRCVK